MLPCAFYARVYHVTLKMVMKTTEMSGMTRCRQCAHSSLPFCVMMKKVFGRPPTGANVW